MSILDKVKEHPALAVGAVVAVLVLVYVLNHSSSSTAATSTVSGTSVDAATGLQQAQLQASSQANQVSAALQANATNTAAQVQLATIASQQAGAHDVLAAQVATSQINASQQVQSLLGSLSAGVSENASNNDLAKTTVLATNQTQQQQIFANALVQQSQTQASVAIAGYNATTTIAGINAGAVTAIQSSHDQHSGGLFGGGGFLGLGG